MVGVIAGWAVPSAARDVPDERYVLQGHLARVTRPINGAVNGEIAFEVEGRRQIATATSLDGTSIAVDAEVVIERLENGIAYVERWTTIAKQTRVAVVARTCAGRSRLLCLRARPALRIWCNTRCAPCRTRWSSGSSSSRLSSCESSRRRYSFSACCQTAIAVRTVTRPRFAFNRVDGTCSMPWFRTSWCYACNWEGFLRKGALSPQPETHRQPRHDVKT